MVWEAALSTFTNSYMQHGSGKEVRVKKNYFSFQYFKLHRAILEKKQTNNICPPPIEKVGFSDF